MIRTVKQACQFNPVIQNYRKSAAIENLADIKRQLLWPVAGLLM
jgi:hypothetical protein